MKIEKFTQKAHITTDFEIYETKKVDDALTLPKSTILICPPYFQALYGTITRL